MERRRLLAGGGLVFALMHAIQGLTTVGAAVICGYMALMLGICMLATVVPTRRALRVAPTEALRAQ